MEPLPLAPEADIPEKATATTQPGTDASDSAHAGKADDNGPREEDTSFLKLNADNVVADEAATGGSKAAANAQEDKTTTSSAKGGEDKGAKTITRAETEEDVPSLKTYTIQDVSSHNKPNDLWLVVGGDIFNVTKFQHEHPGGAKSKCKTQFSQLVRLYAKSNHLLTHVFAPTVMAGVAGKDATKKYDKYHRRAILDQYKPKLHVGTLVASEAANGPKKGLFQRLGFGKGS